MTEADRKREIVAARLAAPPLHPRPGFAKLAGEDLVRRFVSELRGKAASVVEIDGIEDLARVVEAELTHLGLSLADLAVAPDPTFRDVVWSGHGAGPKCDASLGAAKVSLTRAFGGVAETGALVVASGPLNPTEHVFLPDVHMVFLRRSEIFAAYEDALGALLRETGELPRAVTLVSGPSRTGDIGGRIVLGAHGPRRVIVVLAR